MKDTVALHLHPEGAPSKLRLGGVFSPLLIRVSPLQPGDVNLLHLQHRIHDPAGLRPVFVGQKLD